MKHFLSILLRNQFNLFYRFGYTYIPKCQLLEFDGVIYESTKEGLIRLFSETTPFEWEEEYLIIHFDKNGLAEGEVFNFQIQDVVKVYPLSAQAKSSIETKIDQRIKLERPIFENILPKVEHTIEMHELEKAIQALWNVCDIEDDLNKFISNIGLDNIFNGLERRKQGTKPNKIKNGNYWEYVLAYDRFDYFPNSILGYFYDAGQIFANTKGLPSFEGSELYKFLQSINNSKPDIKIKDILKLLETNEQGKKYVSQTIVNEQLQYQITPLYLMLKDEIRKAEDIKNTNLFKHLKTLKEFGSSFNYSIILLGAFFGFKKFYDAYYDNLNLRFYKSHRPVNGKKEETEIIDTDNQPVVREQTISKYILVSEKNQVLDDNPKFEEQSLTKEKQVSGDKLIIEGQPLSNEHLFSKDRAEPLELTVHEVHPISGEQGKSLQQQREKSDELETQEKIETINESEDLPIEVVKQELSENPIEHQTISNSETEIVIKLKKIINDLLNAKTEMKLTDIGYKIKELTGQKITNTIIKNVIKSMDNIEIVPKKKPETARQVIMQDLFDKQV